MCGEPTTRPDSPVSPGERYGYIYEINLLRCIFCGLCVEACPTEAITMSHLFEMSTTNRDDAIYTRDTLLMDTEGTVPHMFPSDSMADLAELQQPDGWLTSDRTIRPRRLLRSRRLDPRRRHRPP